MYNASNNRWKPGVRFGMNYQGMASSGTSIDYDRSKFGFNFGIFMDYSTRNFIFQPGIAYSSKGAKISTPNETLKLNYLEIPLRFSMNTFKYKFIGCAQSVRLNLEPYGAYVLNGKSGNEDIRFESSEQGFNRFDYGLKAGIKSANGKF